MPQPKAAAEKVNPHDSAPQEAQELAKLRCLHRATFYTLGPDYNKEETYLNQI